ncbi:hypothetical protein [Apibacter sp. HY039]|uniref:hypothetical protein n=1 Tax=Apibacter sp. HY039 TaxID=2501476 RepID=UPI000FEBF4E8|nr:hypothetical protein [Apibacter sp. HY039]
MEIKKYKISPLNIFSVVFVWMGFTLTNSASPYFIQFLRFSTLLAMALFVLLLDVVVRFLVNNTYAFYLLEFLIIVIGLFILLL